MGAWGHTSFENDAAMDWLLNLEDQGAPAILAAFELSDDYIELDEASAAIAAAELVAMARDGNLAALHPSASDLFNLHLGAIKKIDKTSAHEAVQRVYDASELRELWDENGADTEWHQAVRALLKRLT